MFKLCSKKKIRFLSLTSLIFIQLLTLSSPQAQEQAQPATTCFPNRIGMCMSRYGSYWQFFQNSYNEAITSLNETYSKIDSLKEERKNTSNPTRIKEIAQSISSLNQQTIELENTANWYNNKVQMSYRFAQCCGFMPNCLYIPDVWAQSDGYYGAFEASCG